MELHIDGLVATGVIGRGGFGVVHRAVDHAHGRTVAVKTLPPLADDAARRRFDRERRAMGSLSGHPHIGVIHTSGITAAGEPYLVMELLSGGSLADRLAHGPMPVADVLAIGAALADALETAHRAGVLHLDMKPENVLFSDFGRPKIVDFGIAALLDDESASTTIRGTPSFADPEVLDGRPAGPASDVYGLAATMYALLAGRAPYATGDGDTSLGVLRRLAIEPVPMLDRADVPPALAALLHRAMAKTAAERPASMREFATALAGIGVAPEAPTPAPPGALPPVVAPSPVQPAPPSPPTNPVPAPGQRLGVALLVGAIVVVMIVVISALSGGGDGDPPRADTADDGPSATPAATLVSVPSVIGQDETVASAALERIGLEVRSDPHCFSIVRTQSPDAGAEVTPSSIVTLGFDECVVPDLVGRRLPDAIATVEEINAMEIAWSDHCDDLITGQSVPAGTVVEPFSTTIELELPTTC